MNIEIFKNTLNQIFQHPVAGSFGAVFVAAFSTLFGNSKLAFFGMALFILVLIMDWISGYRAAKKDGSFASEYGINGAFRTFFILLFPVLAHQADMLMELPNILFGFCLLAFGLPIWNSMTANAVRCGWERWIPMWALNAVADELAHKQARAKRRLIEKNIIKEEDKENGL